MKSKVRTITRSAVIVAAEDGVPYAFFKRNHNDLYDAEIGMTVTLELLDGGRVVPTKVEWADDED